MNLPILFGSLLSSLVAVGCSSTTSNGSNGSSGKACTLLACGDEGVRVDFHHKEAGSYAVDVTIDGAKTTCTATLPLSPSAPTDDACTAAGIYLTRIGSALPPAEQSIGGLQIRNANAKSVTVRVTRDGTLLHDATFAPSYVITPGPNGPDCEPKECKSATFALP